MSGSSASTLGEDGHRAPGEAPRQGPDVWWAVDPSQDFCPSSSRHLVTCATPVVIHKALTEILCWLCELEHRTPLETGAGVGLAPRF